MTKAQKFIAKAREVMPHQGDLQDLDPTIDNAGHIDEIMFRKGEYLGGMTAVILALISE